jgi:hypothetical protein
MGEQRKMWARAAPPGPPASFKMFLPHTHAYIYKSTVKNETLASCSHCIAGRPTALPRPTWQWQQQALYTAWDWRGSRERGERKGGCARGKQKGNMHAWGRVGTGARARC